MKPLSAFGGAVLGSIVGFLLRPTYTVLFWSGQVPLDVMFGKGVSSSDSTANSMITTAWGYVFAGAIVGALVSLMAAQLLTNQRRPQ